MMMIYLSAEEKEEFIRHLECPVCLDYMHTAISTCVNGHSMCIKCVDKLQECPLCKQPFATTRNITLENIISTIKLPCLYECSRCYIPVQEIREHEMYCEKNPNWSCPVDDTCEWKGLLADLKGHVEFQHTRSIINPKNLNLQTLIINVYKDKRASYCFFHEDNLFELHMSVAAHKEVQLIVTYRGPKEEWNKYRFTCVMTSRPNNQIKRIIFTANCKPFDQFLTELEYSVCSLSYTIVQDLLKDKSYRGHIGISTIVQGCSSTASTSHSSSNSSSSVD